MPAHCRTSSCTQRGLCLAFHAGLGARAPGVAAHQRTRRQGRALSHLYMFAETLKDCHLAITKRHGKVCRGQGHWKCLSRFGRKACSILHPGMPLHGRDKPQACVLVQGYF